MYMRLSLVAASAKDRNHLKIQIHPSGPENYVKNDSQTNSSSYFSYNESKLHFKFLHSVSKHDLIKLVILFVIKSGVTWFFKYSIEKVVFPVMVSNIFPPSRVNLILG